MLNYFNQPPALIDERAQIRDEQLFQSSGITQPGTYLLNMC